MGIVKTRKGEQIIVDDSDLEAVSAHTWSIETSGYAVTNTPDPKRKGKYRVTKMHRLIMGFTHGDKQYVDHINGDKLDNRRANLRPATNSQNLCNRKAPVSNRSGYKGVSFHKASSKWRATICQNYKYQHLGLFETAEQAADAYAKAAVKLHGAFANIAPLMENGLLEVTK